MAEKCYGKEMADFCVSVCVFKAELYLVLRRCGRKELRDQLSRIDTFYVIHSFLRMAAELRKKTAVSFSSSVRKN